MSGDRRGRLLISLPERGETSERLLELARKRGFRRFVVGPDHPPDLRPGEEWYRREGDVLHGVTDLEMRLPIREVRDPESLRGVLEGSSPTPWVLRFRGDRILPLESALAASPSNASVWVLVDRVEEVAGALGALEHGAGAVIAPARSPEDLDRLEEYAEQPAGLTLAWQTVTVRRADPAGMGDRVCVDSTSLLGPREGLLVGSAAALLFLVASEAVGSAFTRPRPFRVNAGAAHSYVLLADGSTRYLSELEPGDALLAVDGEAGQRLVRVGRTKTERRPLTLVEVEAGSERFTLFAQEAETVRLVADSGAVAITQLRAGDTLRAARLPPARHLGVEVTETIWER